MTKEQLTQFVRNAVWGHHISGSAPMGNCTTEFAVTDERARVYGVEGLRVCDISLLPSNEYSVLFYSSLARNFLITKTKTKQRFLMAIQPVW